jgi:hypothetical protein
MKTTSKLNYWEYILLIRLEPAGLLLFEMAKSKQKPFPLMNLSLKMRFRCAKPAKLAFSISVPFECSQ